tara:strand:+ start:67 stop:498 length:432 start_codon:yes stop_codon:yes gene_type:complete
MLNIIFLYADINVLKNYEDVYQFIIDKKIDEEIMADHWMMNISNILDLYKLLKIQNDDLKVLIKKEHFLIYGFFSNLKNKLINISDEEIEILSQKWKNLSFSECDNVYSFDICGSLYGIRNYIMNSKHKKLDLVLFVDTENEN